MMSGATTPVISVCVPTRNRAHYLGEALQSVLGQSRQDFEIVVCDDASSDGTSQVVEGLGDLRVRYSRSRTRLGIPRNRDRCLALARGRYIAWLDSDDTYEPSMLETQSAVLDRHPEVGLVHGAFRVIDEAGRRLPDWPAPFDGDVVEPGPEAFRELVLLNYVTTSTVLVRRECHARVGPHATDIGRSSTDWEMWLRLALHTSLAFTAAPVARYRTHGASVSAGVAGLERLRSDVAAVRRVFRHGRRLVPDPECTERRARAALAVKALLTSADAASRGQRRASLSAALMAPRVFAPLRRHHEVRQLCLARLRGDDYDAHMAGRALLRLLYREVDGSRLASRIAPVATSDPAWERALTAVAGTVQRVVPAAEAIAVIDKHDPTILALSGRRGWHFPDWRLAPPGYPAGDGAAIAHLEQLLGLGARYLVVPAGFMWWLDHYREFKGYLDRVHRKIWHDESCVIYRLVRLAAVGDDGILARSAPETHA
jgi:hypothetical protein